jgi:hypothetical protein
MTKRLAQGARTAALTAALLIGMAGSVGSAVAQEAFTFGPSIQRQGNVSFITGGVGFQEREMLREVENQFNLHLLFAERGGGSFIADVQVRIVDPRGQTVLETVTKGPQLLVQLPAGRYRVDSSYEGASQNRSVNVPASGRTSMVFHF